MIRLKRFRIFLVLFSALLFLNCHNDMDKIVNPTPHTNAFIHTRGKDLYLRDSLIFLKGTSVGNRVWQNDDWPEEEFSERDYQNIKDMGMNTIRFLMSYKNFESGGQTDQNYTIKDWAWLDTNLAWAAKHGIYLILNIHIPQGYDDSRERAKMAPLWENPQNLEKFKKMWKQIALKYKDEPMIAGYDILNEPFVPGTREQWMELAQQTVDSIRTVDTNHIIIIERLENELGGTGHYDDPDYVFFPVNDRYNNLMYSFHFYKPFEFTHQLIFGNPEGGSYPDTAVLFPDDLTWSSGVNTTPTVAKGTGEWTFLDGDADPFEITDSAIIAGKPIMAAHFLNDGVVYYDDITVKEYDEFGNFIRIVTTIDIESGSIWFKWSQNNDGQSGFSTEEFHSGTSSYYYTGTSGYGSAYNDSYRFPVRYGYSYAVSGWAKGVNVPDSAQCRFSIDFEKSASGATFTYTDKDYLRRQFAKFNQFGITNNIPIYVGEFGLNYGACKQKGAAVWFDDLLDILDENRVHWTHHIYNGWWFGFFSDENSGGNYIETTELTELFKRHLKGL